MPKTALTPKARRFALEYVIDLDGAKAATRAGYSRKTANYIAYQLLKKPAIRALVDAAQKEIDERLVMKREEVLRRLTLQARADPRSLYRDDGTLKSIHELDDIGAATLAAVDYEVRGGGDDQARVTKIKHRDPIKALELLSRHHGVLNDPPPPPHVGPGMTVIVQQGVQVDGSRVVAAHSVRINLPPPAKS